MEGLFGGLISGTSLDGVDAILLEIRGSDSASVVWDVVGFVSEPYRDEDRARIRHAIDSGGARELTLIHAELARHFAHTFRTLLDKTETPPPRVKAIGSHGQTVWHEPPTPGCNGVTLQLGDSGALAEELGCPVVGDFRSRDMAAGGHGAPLVPWSDWVLLRRPGVGCALQNLGGMGNVTFIPADGRLEAVIGFDTGPGVALLDRAAQLASGGVDSWDLDGRRAARGTILAELLAELLEDEFFEALPPKSTGRERFGDERLDGIVDALQPQSDGAWDDLLATLTELTASSVAVSYERFLPKGAVQEVVLAGGGARNPTLVAALERHLAPLPVSTGAQALGIDPDAREAAAFALLAWAHVNSIPGNVPSVTGAKGRRVLGALYPGRRPGGEG